MLEQEFFSQRPESHPTIYAYEFVGVASHQGYIDKKMSKIDVKFAAGQKSFIIEKGNSFNAFVRGFLRFE